MIEFQNVTKLYKSVLGVNEINVSMASGAYGLLGPNGSGKTTLINLLIGQLNPTIGQVRLFGENPRGNDHLLRRVGLCPTTHPEIPRISGWEWVQFLVRQHGFSWAEADQRARAALEQVRMTEAMHRPINTYSLGMRQRTKLAQAIAHDPDLLILDEPFNGLDPVARHEMTELLRGWRQKGKSLIVASHVLHEVEAINPSFLLLSNGRLLASGSAREVRSLLTEIPSTIRIRSSSARRLAALLAAHPDTDSLVISADEQEVSVSTRSPAALYAVLPNWTREHDLFIHGISSSDTSLQQLFTTLMQIHRGQTRTRRPLPQSAETSASSTTV